MQHTRQVLYYMDHKDILCPPAQIYFRKNSILLYHPFGEKLAQTFSPDLKRSRSDPGNFWMFVLHVIRVSVDAWH